MLPCMNYCQVCKKFSVQILTSYRGKLMCRNCADKKRKEEYENERKNKAIQRHF